ncbi:MAG: ABC transporter substrate-binding protein [Clostridiales bacterium]|nr:ABC transporter substrate-binding protein [Clostridiales bacterium]
MKTRKRFFVSLLLAALMMSVFPGCGNSKSAQTASPQAGENAGTAKDSVIIAISSEPSSLDPCKGWGHGTTPLVQSTLVEYKQDMSFEKDLATEYSVSDDGLVWTFKIRTDVKFTDGEPLTASDVAFTFNTAKKSQSSLDLTFMDKAEAPSDDTVIFTLNRPTSTFLNTIATTGIVPEHAYGEDYGTNPIGSGPFVFVQWNKGEQLMLKANENYYRDVPKIKNITLVFMQEDAAFAAVKAGQVDVALTSATLATAAVDGYYLKTVTSLDNRGLTLPVQPNEGKKTESGYIYGNNVTCNKEIRQALAYGIDRVRISKEALNGFADPAYSENDGMPWNNPEVKIDTDVEYAKKLLADNGWKDTDGDGIVEKNGLKAEFTCLYASGDSFRQALAMATAAQAKELGISIKIEGTSWDDISKRMFSEAVLMAWGSSNPYTSYCLFHSDNMLKDDYYNPEGYSNPVVDKYLEAAMQSLTVDEANENWKKAQWDGTTGTAMKGDCPWVWLVNMQHLYYVRNGLDIGEQQLHAHGASMPLLQNLKEWTWK